MIRDLGQAAHASRITFHVRRFTFSLPGGNPMTLTRIHWVRSGSAGDDLAIAYAGRELAGYLGKLTGTRPAVSAASRVNAQPGTVWLGICDRLPPPTGALSPTPWDDGFAIWADGGALYIASRNARSVLFGVYAFLETQGVRFVRPGPAGEVIPAIADVDAALNADRGDRALPTSRGVHRGCDLARPRARHGRLVRQAADEHRFPAIHPQRLLLQPVVRTEIQSAARRRTADRSRGVAIR